MNKKKQLCIRIEEELHHQVKRIAVDRLMTMESFIKELILKEIRKK